MKKIAVLGVAVSLLCGCTTPTLPTASGRPEITFNGKVSDQISAKIADRMLNAHYSLKSSSKNLMVFEKPLDGVLAGVLFGSHYDSTPAARVTYTIVEGENSTRVVASASAITNPGSAFERATRLDSGKDAERLQKLLNDLRSTQE